VLVNRRAGPEAVVLAEDAMVGVGESPHTSGQVTHMMALRLLLLLSLTTLLALLFTGCSAGGSAGGGGNGSNECFYSSACDTGCNDANCDSGGTGSGTTDGGSGSNDGGGSGGCTDAADPSCGGYDPTGGDGGGNGDGGCDPSTCGDPGDGGGDSGIGEIRGYIGTVIMVAKAAETMALAQPFVSAPACASPETLSELKAVCSRFAPLETQGRLPGLSIAQTTYARVVRAKEDKDESAT